MKRRAAKTDANQTKVVEHLRKAGLSVAVTSMVGNGFPDLVVAGHRTQGRFSGIITLLVELKNPAMPPSKQKLTPDEVAFIASWKGEIIVATTAEEILKLFGK